MDMPTCLGCAAVRRWASGGERRCGHRLGGGSAGVDRARRGYSTRGFAAGFALSYSDMPSGDQRPQSPVVGTGGVFDYRQIRRVPGHPEVRRATLASADIDTISTSELNNTRLSWSLICGSVTSLTNTQRRLMRSYGARSLQWSSARRLNIPLRCKFERLPDRR